MERFIRTNEPCPPFEKLNSNPPTGIQDLLMVCKDEKAILEKQRMLVAWIKDDPSAILTKARLENTATPLAEYLRDLEGLLRSSFTRSCLLPEERTIHRQRVILRYVVYMQLRMMDANCKSQRSPLQAYRNPDTAVEASRKKRLQDGFARGPPNAVEEVLNSSLSFFSEDDRSRVRIFTTALVPSPLPAIPALPVLEKELQEPTNGPYVSLSVASLEQTRSVSHRFVLRLPFYGVLLYHHHPMEVYMAWGLHKIRHVYENLGPLDHWPPRFNDLTSGKLIMSDTCGVEKCPSTFIAARPGSSIYDSSYPPEVFQLPIKVLFEFVVRHGKADATRSSGWRLDLSNAGQAFEEQTEVDRFSRPKILCGDSIFLADADGPLVRAVLGRLVDGVSRSAQLMCHEMRMPHSLNARRYNEYALKLQEFLFAKLSFFESITVQLLNLSKGDHGEEHVDVMNDHRSSYDGTAVKVMNFIDSNSDLYSLKIICGFRKRLGDFYSVAMSKIERLMLNARTMLLSVDASYARLISSHKGGYHPDLMPTWSNIDSIYIDDNSLWTRRRISPLIWQENLTLLTGISCGIWLSAGLSSIQRIAPSLSERGMLQLLMVMSWQNSFQNFWEICLQMNLSDGDEYPIYEYYRVANRLFYQHGKEKGQEMFGGESPRFSPIAFDFKEVFGTDLEQRQGVIDAVLCVDRFFGRRERYKGRGRPSICPQHRWSCIRSYPRTCTV